MSYVLNISVSLTIAVLIAAACTGGSPQLTQAELNKCAPAIQRLLQGQEPEAIASIPESTNADGETVYLLLLRVTDADAVRNAGVPLNSVQGTVATARLTMEQIRTAVRLNAVTRIEPSGRSLPTQ